MSDVFDVTSIMYETHNSYHLIYMFSSSNFILSLLSESAIPALHPKVLMKLINPVEHHVQPTDTFSTLFTIYAGVDDVSVHQTFEMLAR